MQDEMSAPELNSVQSQSRAKTWAQTEQLLLERCAGIDGFVSQLSESDRRHVEAVLVGIGSGDWDHERQLSLPSSIWHDLSVQFLDRGWWSDSPCEVEHLTVHKAGVGARINVSRVHRVIVILDVWFKRDLDLPRVGPRGGGQKSGVVLKFETKSVSGGERNAQYRSKAASVTCLPIFRERMGGGTRASELDLFVNDVRVFLGNPARVGAVCLLSTMLGLLGGLLGAIRLGL